MDIWNCFWKKKKKGFSFQAAKKLNMNLQPTKNKIQIYDSY